MGNCYVPVCYFPSKIMLVDDSKDFLINFSLQLSEMLDYQLYNSPQQALEALQQMPPQQALHQRCLSEQIETVGCPLTTQSFNFDLSAIHSLAYNPRRFSETTVVIIDYAMPGINGIELCEQLVDIPVSKILLTGRADEKTAIAAFNDGLIDTYVQKNDPDIITKVNRNILQLQKRHFQEMSLSTVNMLSINGLQCLQDRKFAEFFEQLCQQLNIVEYYLTEMSGSFLLLDSHANASCLIIKSQQDLEYCRELAIDNHAPPEVITQLEQGSCVPYFWLDGDTYQDEWTDWDSHLLPAKSIECKQPYYYALVQNTVPFNITMDKILSYHYYLDGESPLTK